MTFKGMLKIVMNDYRKQHDEKLFSIVQELMKTRRELQEVKEKLYALQSSDIAPLSDNCNTSALIISLFVQYNGFFNQLCDIRQTMTIEQLLVKLHRLTGIAIDQPIRIRVLSEDGLTTICFLHKEVNRTLESYNDLLKPRMILSIEDNDKHLERSRSTTSSERTYSFDESDV